MCSASRDDELSPLSSIYAAQIDDVLLDRTDKTGVWSHSIEVLVVRWIIFLYLSIIPAFVGIPSLRFSEKHALSEIAIGTNYSRALLF